MGSGAAVVPFRGRRWGALWGATGKGKGGSSASYPVHLSLPLMSIAVLPPLPTLRKTGCGPVHALAPKYESAKTTGVVSVVCGGGAASEGQGGDTHPGCGCQPSKSSGGGAQQRSGTQGYTGVHGVHGLIHGRHTKTQTRGVGLESGGARRRTAGRVTSGTGPGLVSVQILPGKPPVHSTDRNTTLKVYGLKLKS